jgi:hypothetical protein
MQVNTAGYENAVLLIRAGKVDLTSAWGFSADDGNSILGDSDWATYSKFHLAFDSSKSENTKEYYKYPFGKDGKVYRGGIVAIRQRAGQTGDSNIFEAAGRLLDLLPEVKSDAGKYESRYSGLYDTTKRLNVEENRITGHAAVFNSYSRDLGGFVEKIDPNAFREALNDDVRAFYNHDRNYVLGRVSAGTLRLGEDEVGLSVDIDIPDTTWANDLKISMQRGDVNQMSFGFTVTSNGDSWSRSELGLVRTIHRVSRLHDVSVVTVPAYEGTYATVRGYTSRQSYYIRKAMIRSKMLNLREIV